VLVSVACAASPVLANATQKGSTSGSDDPLSSLAQHFGLPAGLVVAGALVWGLVTQADKLEKIMGWFGFKPGVRKPSSGSQTAEGSQDPTVRQEAATNQGVTVQSGAQSTIHVTYQQPSPASDHPKGLGGRALSNLPPNRKGFVARSAELQALSQELESEGSQVVIHGMPGVGKSSLALQYASTSTSSYGAGVWWFDATEGFETMAIQAIPELEKEIADLEAGEGLRPEVRLRRCLQAWGAGHSENALLVVDNLPAGREGQEFLRCLGSGLPGLFRLLITQRSEPITAVPAIDLQVLGREDSLQLLSLHAGESGRVRIQAEAEQAAALVRDVDGLPLALILLAGRLRMVPSLSVEALRKDLARPNLEASTFRSEHADLLAEQGVIVTLLASWQTLPEEAQELALLLSLTLPGPIPWELITPCIPAEAVEPVDQHWHQALAALVGANLLDRLDARGQLYGLHALVRQFFGIQRQGWTQESFYRQRLAMISQELASAKDGADVVAAVTYWRQASSAVPTAASAGFGLGHSLIRFGDLEGARQAFEQSKAAAQEAQDQRGVSRALNGIGDVLKSQGDGAGALAAYHAGLTIAEGLEQCDPANTYWQHDLFVSQSKVADFLVSQGDGAGALAAYQACQTIAEGLAKRDPANTRWQRDLSAIHGRIGKVLVSQGDGAGALAAYQAGLRIAEGLVKRDPANTLLQRGLSVSYERIGDVLESQGDRAGALAAYQASLTIAEGLAKRDPANTLWERDLSMSHNKIGDVLESQGDGAGALTAYQACLTIAEGLAKRDPTNTLFQRDLSASHSRIGTVLESQGDGAGALAAYQAGLTIAEGLVKLDPANTEWQRDLYVSKVKIGDVLVSQGDGAGALAAYQAGLTIAEGLAKLDPANTEWQRDLSVSHGRIGKVLESQGDGAGALAAYQACLTIAEGLAKRDPANTLWQRDLSVAHNKIGNVLESQEDGAGALAAYQAGLTIAEGLAQRYPANTQWQMDVAVSCAKLGMHDSLLSIQERKGYLSRGLELLAALKQAGRLHSTQDWTGWFENALCSLE